MKITVEVERDQCDFCGRVCDYGSPCRECGLTACYDCRDIKMVTLHSSPFTSGYGDLFYCLECHSSIWKEGKDILFMAYKKIESLRLEQDGFYKNWKERMDKAVEKAERLFEESKREI